MPTEAEASTSFRLHPVENPKHPHLGLAHAALAYKGKVRPLRGR